MSLVSLTYDGDMARLALSAPRANALEPDLLAEMSRTLDKVAQDAPAHLMLFGGRNFCSGGDVARFLEAVEAREARAYAARVVPVLHEVLMRLMSLPCPVILAARGAITGGGAGFLFASDLALVAPGTFVQPYYGRMGFAPDGGWTAILPDRIGAARAQRWLMTDERLEAAALCDLGLAAQVSDTPEDDARALARATDPGTQTDIKRLLRSETSLGQFQSRLDAETARFMDALERPETRTRMRAFLSPQKV
ncbi:enoyl-CoA hydratase/isomerase family protein [Primorskyibacter aestuariivivens]|uniref:enoyl-CoA hydratase/isomerase family protein n=1 Tax=Primorskyibacter aestuariivivens TaxID=1888912 RepID=UPI00230100FE|nr:enoyl-CoA hydratase/isomerase family protein [Primorskyibacter aestuariivivens]MDA7427308.1 enoyl-CoA hydratase/isomerase family protein [Primorskyibacter aestuariivivens]